MFCVTPDVVIMNRACNTLGANGSQACQYTVRLGHWWGYGRVMWFLERYENPPPFGLLALTGNSNPEMMSVSFTYFKHVVQDSQINEEENGECPRIGSFISRG